MDCPAHAELGLSVARELGCSLEGTDRALHQLAHSLTPGDAYSELQGVRALCETFGRGPALLLPDVLRARAGHPDAIAVAVAAAAQRAGLSIDVVANIKVPGTFMLAHPDAPMVVEASGRLLDGRTLGMDLEWRCAHETSATILDRVAERAERTGDLALAIAARGIALPLDGDERRREHARLLARLN
jgi:hypothetical protein